MQHDDERTIDRHHMTRRAFVGSGLLGGTLAIAEPFLPSLRMVFLIVGGRLKTISTYGHFHISQPNPLPL